MKQASAKHEFALYIESLAPHIHDSLITIHDKVLAHRMQHVLRLQAGMTCIVFDRDQHAQVVLESLDKLSIRGRVLKQERNLLVQPSITVMVPLLKREALEEALYSCVELGATNVQLMITDKVQRSWAGQKELERLERIMIAAAEQSKNFAYPRLVEPRPLIDLFAEQRSSIIFFDPAGQPLQTVLPTIQHVQNITLVIGPEGDLSHEEKALLTEQKAVFCRLTPTIMRACQAVAVSLGILRSWLTP